MRDLSERYETDRIRMREVRELSEMGFYSCLDEQRAEPIGRDLPPLPPVSHMELGRQESFCFPDRRRDPFEGAITNNVVAFEQPPVTLESITAAMERLVDEVDPLPAPFPWEDPDHILILKPRSVGKSELGIQIYWTDREGRTWSTRGRVA